MKLQQIQQKYNKLPLWGKIVCGILGGFLFVILFFIGDLLPASKDELKSVVILLIVILTLWVIVYFTLPTISIQSLEEFANNLKFPTFI